MSEAAAQQAGTMRFIGPVMHMMIYAMRYNRAGGTFDRTGGACDSTNNENDNTGVRMTRLTTHTI